MSVLADDAIRHYLNLPYRIALIRDGTDEERPWRATVEDLPGCEARGSTAADAAAKVPAALAEWVARAHASGREVPEPRGARDYSGRLLLRMPKTLHSELAHAAERDEVSLNAYINLLLATAMHPPPGGGGWVAGAWPGDTTEELVPPTSTVRLQRFLAIALAANVLMAAVVATLAVILLLTAS